MGAWMRCSRWLGGWTTALLVAVAPVAQASPVIGLSSASGFAGDTVSLTVSGNLDLFLASELTVNFDPLVLAFSGITPADYLILQLTLGAPGAPATLFLSIVSDNPGVGNFAYFDLLFTIRSDAPAGLSNVEILKTPDICNSSGLVDCHYFLFDDANGDIEIVILNAPISANVNVLTRNEVPLPGTASLALAALGLLALSRRSRKALAPAVPA